MLVLPFGDVRPHESREGTIGDYTLHVQWPWRFDGPEGTVTARGDLWVYAGPESVRRIGRTRTGAALALCQRRCNSSISSARFTSSNISERRSASKRRP